MRLLRQQRGAGGGLSCFNSESIISNSVFADNDARAIDSVFGSLEITCCQFSGNAGGIAFNGGGSSHTVTNTLQAGSPCIDAAADTAVPAGTTTVGDPRFVDDPDTADSGPGNPPIVDMGSYEFQPIRVGCPGDTDGDGQVNVGNLTNVVLDWGTDGSANGGDVTGSPLGSSPDGKVNVSDLNAVILGWSGCP